LEDALDTVERSFRVEGEAGLGASPRAELVGPLLAELPEALLDAVRMGFLHSSRPRGRVPGMLSSASQVRFVGMDGEGDTATLLHFRVPTLGSVAGDLFRQQKLWDDTPQPDQTAFELLGRAFEDIAERRSDSNCFDTGLLRRVAAYRRVLRRGIQRVSLPDARLATVPHVDEAVVLAASELAAATPRPKRVRVAGRLDVIGAKQGLMKLEVGAGQFVTALWDGASTIESLRDHWNKKVVVEGSGVFRPSGALLRIDADAIRLESAADRVFERIPVAHVRRDFSRAARLRVGEASVYARMLGAIPPEESDEEFAAAVDALS